MPVDGHVHFHESWKVPAVLDAAAANFRVANGDPRGFLGVILLAQSSGERIYEALRESAAVGEWLLAPVAGEPETLIARKADSTIVVVCGRQVRADDGLEVLALGTCEEFPDGLPIEGALEAVGHAAALAVIPWGLGKLLGERGRRVGRLLAARRHPTLFVGDNGSRLHVAGLPRLIRDARSKGLHVLPGTDPFPIGRDYRRVGSFGFLAEEPRSANAPWGSLRAWLTGRTGSPEPFGRACSPARFLWIQAGIQVHNRLRRSQPL